jgi:hypothetical protein
MEIVSLVGDYVDIINPDIIPPEMKGTIRDQLILSP